METKNYGDDDDDDYVDHHSIISFDSIICLPFLRNLYTTHNFKRKKKTKLILSIHPFLLRFVRNSFVVY